MMKSESLLLYYLCGKGKSKLIIDFFLVSVIQKGFIYLIFKMHSDRRRQGMQESLSPLLVTVTVSFQLKKSTT